SHHPFLNIHSSTAIYSLSLHDALPICVVTAVCRHSVVRRAIIPEMLWQFVIPVEHLALEIQPFIRSRRLLVQRRPVTGANDITDLLKAAERVFLLPQRDFIAELV